ncbi:hypothetical protein CDO52_00865 [Nocardiopsis gilva YIM 90087]|uniref:Uncharacterized protein n=1 Tax=Nocardiopsis gilva YIM 90087 TaxID=1235441 RepID=A0A223S077_9ACTN|nr:hypothetical protein [Nocardiopsis gilva]ASU81530.1 hypothetical protein CDO52_00865 [Nocardiopsis gilva YIM 90087]
MSLPDYDDAYARARERAPFANGTEGYAWIGQWCGSCVHDREGRAMTGPGCPLILVSLMGRTPAEWLDGPRDEQGLCSLHDQYHCMYFRDEDDGGDPEPRPIPDPPGQEALLTREGLEGARMLTGCPQPAKEPQ